MTYRQHRKPLNMGFFALTLTLFIFVSTGKVSAKSFDDYIESLARHPQVMQILEQSAGHKELAAAAMGLPDPLLLLGVDNMPAANPDFDRFLPTSKVIGFTQQIPSYSARKAKSQQQEKLSHKQRLVADYTVARLKAVLISMLVNLDKVKQQEEYARSQLDHYKELEEYFKGRMESGSGVYWRFSEIDVERSLVASKLNDLVAQRDEIEAELIRLVGEVPDIPLPEIPYREWNGEDEGNLYPLLIAREDIAVAAKSVDIAEAAFLPNYGINAVYKQRESGSNFAGDDWMSVKATISIPLWYHWNQQPKLRAATAQKRSAENAYENMARMWKRKLRTLASKRDAALANVLVFVEKDKALGEMVDAAERNYEAGENDLDMVLNAQIDRLTIKSQLAEQRAQHLTLSAEFNSHIIGAKK